MKQVAIAGAALLIGAVVFAQGSSTAGVSKLAGKKMPAWSVKTIDGKTLSNANTKGKVVLLDFWASWCGPCKAASPSMQALHAAHAKSGLIVVGANGLEQKPGPAAAKAYKAEHKYTYTFAYDTDKLSDKLGIVGIPTFIVIDRKGKVSYVATSWAPDVKANLEKAVKAALAAK